MSCLFNFIFIKLKYKMGKTFPSYLIMTQEKNSSDKYCKSIDHWKAGLQLFHAGQNIDTILHTIGVVKWQTIILRAHFLLENLFIYLSKSIHRTRINLPFASLKLCCLDGPLAYNKPQFKGDFFLALSGHQDFLHMERI